MGLLSGYLLSLCPHLIEFPIYVFELVILFLEKQPVLCLDITLPLQPLIPTFQKHFIFIASLHQMIQHLILPKNLFFSLFLDDQLLLGLRMNLPL